MKLILKLQVIQHIFVKVIFLKTIYFVFQTYVRLVCFKNVLSDIIIYTKRNAIFSIVRTLKQRFSKKKNINKLLQYIFIST